MALDERRAKLQLCQNIIQYRFNNEDFLWEALQQAGANSGMSLPEGNKRMAHLGDGVLLMYIRREAWRRGVLRGEAHDLGELVKTNNKKDQVGRELGIDKCVNLNNASSGQIPKGGKLIADAVEAIIGAVYLDSGEDLATATRVIETLQLRLPDERLQPAAHQDVKLRGSWSVSSGPDSYTGVQEPKKRV